MGPLACCNATLRREERRCSCGARLGRVTHTSLCAPAHGPHARHGRDCWQVYGILSTQLLVMFAGVYMCTTVDSIRNYVQENAATLWIAYIMMCVAHAPAQEHDTHW